MRQQTNLAPETQASRGASGEAKDGIWTFFALACAFTWLLAAPAAFAWLQHRTPPPFAVACAGFSAFGPLLSALAVAGRRGQVGAVFGRWRANVGWVALALLAPATIHLLAAAIFALMGGTPAHWRYPPTTPEQLAALVVFPLGEEVGWRGFAQPRMVRRYGAVRGSLVVGAVWGLWHAMYAITPLAAFDALGFGLLLVELPLYSLVIGWIFERARHSLTVALAFHAGAHLDNIQRAPRTDLRLQAVHLVVLLVLAVAAARALATQKQPAK